MNKSDGYALGHSHCEASHTRYLDSRENPAVADLKLPPDAVTKINQIATGEPKAA